jgi:hypothetical protein
MADTFPEDPTVTLREIHRRMEIIEHKLDHLARHVQNLVERLDVAQNPNLQTWSGPRDGNEGTGRI